MATPQGPIPVYIAGAAPGVFDALFQDGDPVHDGTRGAGGGAGAFLASAAISSTIAAQFRNQQRNSTTEYAFRSREMAGEARSAMRAMMTSLPASSLPARPVASVGQALLGGSRALASPRVLPGVGSPVGVTAGGINALGVQVATQLRFATREVAGVLRTSAGGDAAAASPPGSGFRDAVGRGGLAVSGLLGGLVARGLQGTVEGAMLADQFTLLSREIAGVFLPIIRQMTSHLREATTWLQSLTREDQSKLRVAGIGAAALGGTAALAPVLGPFAGLLTSVLAPAFGAVAVTAGPVVAVLGGLAVGMGALAFASRPVREAFGPMGEAMRSAWNAMKPLRDALFSIGETLAVGALQTLSKSLLVLVPVLEMASKVMAEALRQSIGLLEKSGFGIGVLIAKWVDGIDLAAELKKGDELEAKRQAANIAAGRDPGPVNLPGRQLVDEIIGDRGQLAAALGLKLPRAAAGGREQVTLLGQGTETGDASYRRIQDAINRQFGIEDPQLVALNGIKGGIDKLVQQGEQKAGGAAPLPNGEKAG